MNIPIEQFIPSGTGLLTTLVGLAGIWFKFQNRMDNLEKTDIEQDERINNIVKWSHEHEKEASTSRETLMRDISRLEGTNLVIGEQFKQIMLALTDIKERLLSLENKK